MKQVDIYDVIKPEIKNAFTGEKYVKDLVLTAYEEQRKKGLEQKKLHTAELIEYGEPHPITGKRQTRPKSVGKTYNIPPDDGTYCPDKVDRTPGASVDINELMKKWDPSGKQFSNAIAQGITTDAGMRYDDFTDSKSLQEALNITIHAEQQFLMLPAAIRNKFENDPIKFLDYVNDEKTLEEQYALGIRVKKEEPPKDATLKDVVDAVNATAKTKKTPSKGGDTDE